MKIFALALVIIASSFSSTFALAQRRPDANDGRLRQLESLVRDLDFRVRTLELNNTPRTPVGYYCIAQCLNNSSTQAGGRGNSEAEAKQAAFEAVRKNWVCQMEVVECSREN